MGWVWPMTPVAVAVDASIVAERGGTTMWLALVSGRGEGEEGGVGPGVTAGEEVLLLLPLLVVVVVLSNLLQMWMFLQSFPYLHAPRLCRRQTLFPGMKQHRPPSACRRKCSSPHVYATRSDGMSISSFAPLHNNNFPFDASSFAKDGSHDAASPQALQHVTTPLNFSRSSIT